MTEPAEHVHCSRCGKRVSGTDAELGLIVRAWVECPECLVPQIEGSADLESERRTQIALHMLKAMIASGLYHRDVSFASAIRIAFQWADAFLAVESEPRDRHADER